MSAYAVERERFQALMESEGMPREISRRILRWANTLQRCAAAECNGGFECVFCRGKGCARCDQRGVLPQYMPCPAQNGARHLCLCDYRVNSTLPHHERVLYASILSARAERIIREWCGKVQGIGGCRERVCVCHDRGAWAYPGSYPAGCSMCGCHRMPFVPMFQGDPRGACVKLRVPSGKSDSFGGEGICVPTRRY